MSIFMWGSHHNYSLKFVLCIHLSFLIFMLSELMSVKYQKSISKIKKKKKPQLHILNKITTNQRSSHILSYKKLAKNDHKQY